VGEWQIRVAKLKKYAYCPISFNSHVTHHSPCQFAQNVTLVLCHIALVQNCIPSQKSVFSGLFYSFCFPSLSAMCQRCLHYDGTPGNQGKATKGQEIGMFYHLSITGNPHLTPCCPGASKSLYKTYLPSCNTSHT